MPAHDLHHFARRAHYIAKAIETNVNEVKKDAAKEVHQLVDRYTPVDVGTARSNWIARLGHPFRFVYKAYAPLPSKFRPPYGPNPGRAETGNLNAAISQGKGVINRAKPGQSIYITNNLPYIARLNDGYSKQSPAGFVQTAVTVSARLIRAKRVLPPR